MVGKASQDWVMGDTDWSASTQMHQSTHTWIGILLLPSLTGLNSHFLSLTQMGTRVHFEEL